MLDMCTLASFDLRETIDWIGLDWIGLDWIGLDLIGLDWIVASGIVDAARVSGHWVLNVLRYLLSLFAFCVVRSAS